MSDRFDDDQVRAFWTEQAARFGPLAAASWSDQPAIDLEIEQCAARLSDGETVLDVGCANGYSTLHLAMRKRVSIRGLDYIPEMIATALARLRDAPADLRARVTFAEGDITALAEPDNAYDKVISTRVVINLGSWERQVAGLRECARVLKPGGQLLLSEAMRHGWERLNRLRGEFGLPPIPMPAFNTYLDKERVIDVLAGDLDLVEAVNFASTYYVGTRVLKPLLAGLPGVQVDVARADCEWNRFWAQLPAWGAYGTQELLVFRKR